MYDRWSWIFSWKRTLFYKMVHKCKLYPRELVKNEHMCSERWPIETLKLICKSNHIDSSRLWAQEYLYWEFVHVDDYILPIHYNQINQCNNVLYNQLDYRNDRIKKISIEEETVLKSLYIIDSSIWWKNQVKI